MSAAFYNIGTDGFVGYATAEEAGRNLAMDDILVPAEELGDLLASIQGALRDARHAVPDSAAPEQPILLPAEGSDAYLPRGVGLFCGSPIRLEVHGKGLYAPSCPQCGERLSWTDEPGSRELVCDNLACERHVLTHEELESQIAELNRQLSALRAGSEPATSTPGSVELYCRPVIRAFARAMEEQLRANDHKGGWESDGYPELLQRLREETAELFDALHEGHAHAFVYGKAHRGFTRKTGREAADVANFAMMLWHLFGIPAEQRKALDTESEAEADSKSSRHEDDFEYPEGP